MSVGVSFVVFHRIYFRAVLEDVIGNYVYKQPVTMPLLSSPERKYEIPEHGTRRIAMVMSVSPWAFPAMFIDRRRMYVSK